MIRKGSNDENAGFIAPQNKTELRGKAPFAEKRKTAFDEVRDDFFNQSKQKVEAQETMKLQPTNKSRSALKAITDETMGIHFGTIDEEEIWHQKQLLSDDQMTFLFTDSPSKIPLPSQPISPEKFQVADEEYVVADKEYEADKKYEADKEYEADDKYELPSVNHSLLLDDNLDSECSK